MCEANLLWCGHCFFGGFLWWLVLPMADHAKTSGILQCVMPVFSFALAIRLSKVLEFIHIKVVWSPQQEELNAVAVTS
jgi:hypothetical protein